MFQNLDISILTIKSFKKIDKQEEQNKIHV